MKTTRILKYLTLTIKNWQGRRDRRNSDLWEVEEVAVEDRRHLAQEEPHHTLVLQVPEVRSQTVAPIALLTELLTACIVTQLTKTPGPPPTRTWAMVRLTNHSIRIIGQIIIIMPPDTTQPHSFLYTTTAMVTTSTITHMGTMSTPSTHHHHRAEEEAVQEPSLVYFAAAYVLREDYMLLKRWPRHLLSLL